LPSSAQDSPEPGQALVVFHRANAMKARAVRFNIEQDGRPIGQLPAGSELAIPLDPGSYLFAVRAPSWDGVDYLNLTVEAGMTYRVEGEVLWSWPVGRPKFSDVSVSGTPVRKAAPATAGASTRKPAPAAADGTAAMRAMMTRFQGSWHLQGWSLAADGRRLAGSGAATATPHGDYAVTITLETFEAPWLPEASGGGTVRLAWHPQRGYSLETDIPASDRKLQLTGRDESGRLVYYLIGGGGETVTGIPRNSVRIEIRWLDADTWTAETFASVDGSSVQVQATTFSRR
ncbi:MAG: hypothetical protein AAGE01_21740, partial [Pseudomonadota bacterium]